MNVLNTCHNVILETYNYRRVLRTLSQPKKYLGFRETFSGIIIMDKKERKKSMRNCCIGWHILSLSTECHYKRNACTYVGIKLCRINGKCNNPLLEIKEIGFDFYMKDCSRLWKVIAIVMSNDTSFFYIISCTIWVSMHASFFGEKGNFCLCNSLHAYLMWMYAYYLVKNLMLQCLWTYVAVIMFSPSRMHCKWTKNRVFHINEFLFY